MNTTNTKSKRALSNEDSKRSPAKRKFRNENEKRRRDLFSQLICSLETILNIDKNCSSVIQTNKLDKASILRETALYLKKHQHDLAIQINVPSSISRTTIEHTNEILDLSWKPPSLLVTNEEWIRTAIESMNSFFLVAKSDPHNGQIVYVSRNISSFMDYSQNELLNRSLFELILSRDHDQLRDYLLKDHKVLEKCNLSWRRATDDEYEQCTIIGAFRQINQENDGKYLMSLVKVNTLDRTLTIDNQDSSNEFITRINLQGKFIQIDPKTRQFLGYNSYELIGHTFFDFVHPDDLPIIVRAHQIWKENGNGKSDPYRFLSKGQQWIFLQTSSQVQINSWTGKPESYLCTTNSLQNSTEFLQKQVSRISASSQTATAIQSPLTTNTMLLSTSQRRDSSSDTQITTFLSQLDNDTYRMNIRDKLNERRSCKQAEIRIREEEINVIEDIIQFIDEYEAKQLTKSSIRTKKPSLSYPSPPITTINSTNQIIQEDPLNRVSGFETIYNPILLQSPLIVTLEDSPLRSPPILPKDPRHNLSTKDELINDPLTCPLFSPQPEILSISSPITPFSIPSRPSPMTPSPLSPFPRSISPTTAYSTTHDIHNIKPPSTSSSSSSSSTITTTNANPNTLSTEQTQKKSSFNRSLPHSLVS